MNMFTNIVVFIEIKELVQSFEIRLRVIISIKAQYEIIIK